MPRMTFATSALQGASPGLSKLAASIMGSDAAFKQGQDDGTQLQSKLAQALAAARASDAQAQHYTAQAGLDDAKRGVLTGRPGLFEEQVAAAAGTSVPQIQGFRERLRTGHAPMVPMGPETADGQYGQGEMVLQPEVESKIAAALKQFMPLLANAGDLKPDDLAQASRIYGDDALRDQVLAGAMQPGALGGAQAAREGKPLFHTDTTGAVLNQFTGGMETGNPMAQSTIGLRGAQSKQATAGAAENYAQADSARATAQLRRSQQGAIGAGPGRVPVGYRYTSNPDTGEVRLEPIPGGPKDPNAQTGKPLPASASKALLENSTNLRRAQEALTLIEGKKVGDIQGDPEATGWKGFAPNGLLNRMDPAGVPTRAAIADLGSLVIHDRSGAAVTAAEFPRLAPFIPQATDDAKTVKDKLRKFVRNYQDIVGESVDFYRASGYNVPAEKLHTVTPDAAPAAPAPRPGAPAAQPRNVVVDW